MEDHQRIAAAFFPPAVSSPSIRTHSNDFAPTEIVSFSSFRASKALAGDSDRTGAPAFGPSRSTQTFSIPALEVIW